ncbi:hypothetical protein T492DRAFT_921065 [Pavlovales sp. CCMP2436]|nr:hypothetical protein T492DRAFT_921065 [Pavlovales sp. CCMP2436]
MQSRVIASSSGRLTYDEFVGRFDAMASSAADEIGIEYLGCSWTPQLLSVRVSSDSASQEIQDLNKALSSWLDDEEAKGAADLPAGEFELEVGTPGAPETLTRDFEFEVFKGFDVTVTTTEPHKGKSRFEGALHSRDEKSVVLNMVGRLTKIPRELVEEVRLPKAKDGDWL